MFKRTLVTSALPYANGPLHLGHIAGAYLPADMFVRYRKQIGDDIVYICGSDENGVAITIAAEKLGVKPQEIVDKYHHQILDSFNKLGIEFDYYGRTSSKIHHETSSEFFKKLYDDGIFTEKVEEQFYDSEKEMFLPDRYVKGTCPNCGHEDAYGDQCEKCGSSLSPNELINPISTLSGKPPVKKETRHLYIPLGNLQPELEKWLETKTYWKNNVQGQIKSWLNKGLGDRAVTRDLSWGVNVPVDGYEGKVLYVWFDAPIGYISATKEWSITKGDSELWKKYWQDQETQLIHFIGKDNIVFHCIMFPAALQTHGKYVLPDNVPANEFLNLEGKKLSTSRGWAVWVHEFLEDFPPDYIRYGLSTILPENKDSDFSWKDFQTRINSELADILGNFINRTQTFIHRFFDGKIPDHFEPTENELNILTRINEFRNLIAGKYEHYQFKEAVTETMNLARAGNKFFTDEEPWKTNKTDINRCGSTLYICSQIIAALSILFDPVLPFTMKQLRTTLHIKDNNWNFDIADILPPGTQFSPFGIPFSKIDDSLIEKQLIKLEQSLPKPKESLNSNLEPLKSEIEYDDFSKLDLRTGTILNASKIKKSDKLLKLEVDLGFEKRTILSGIANYYSIESLPGKKVVIVANLKPRKIMGFESKGMILMAESPDGTLHFLQTETEDGYSIS